MLSVNIISFITVAIPMLFGNTILDARHIVLIFFGLNMFTLFAFMMRSGSNASNIDYCRKTKFLDYFIGDWQMLIPSVISSVVLYVLPWILNIFDGRYDLYKVEYSFIAFLVLNFVVSGLMFYVDDLKNLKNIYKNILLISEFFVTVSILAISFLWKPFGILFGVSGSISYVYLLISVVPAVVYVTLFFSMGNIKRYNKK